MAKIVTFTCVLPNGVHARPASHIETLCNGFRSRVEWHNSRSGLRGDGKSVLSLIGTDTLLGDECRITIEGEDEQAAFERLSQFIQHEFPHCDEALPQVDDQAEQEPIPQSLANLNPTLVRARSVNQGTANGKLVHLARVDLNALTLPPTQSVEQEQQQLAEGLTRFGKALDLQVMGGNCTTTAVLEAHRSLLRDGAFRQHLLDGVLAGKAVPPPLWPPQPTSASNWHSLPVPICASVNWIFVMSASSCYSKFMASSASRRNRR